jgi:hypothetical protein
MQTSSLFTLAALNLAVAQAQTTVPYIDIQPSAIASNIPAAPSFNATYFPAGNVTVAPYPTGTGVVTLTTLFSSVPVVTTGPSGNTITTAALVPAATVPAAVAAAGDNAVASAVAAGAGAAGPGAAAGAAADAGAGAKPPSTTVAFTGSAAVKSVSIAGLVLAVAATLIV